MKTTQNTTTIMEHMNFEQRSSAAQQKPVHEFPVTLSYKYTRKGNTQKGQEIEMALVTTRENATGSIIGMHVEVLVDGMLYAHCETVGEAGAAWKSAVNEERLIMGSIC